MKIQISVELDADITSEQAERLMDGIIADIRRRTTRAHWPVPVIEATLTVRGQSFTFPREAP
jgi:hypothetical protein